MEIRHLKYFLEVTKDLNMTKAAQRLGVSQPPLSRQIKQLEEELNVLLFDRSSKQLKLTEAGAIFRVKAEQILNNVDETKSAMQKISLYGPQWINIGIVPSTIYGFLPALLRRYKKNHQDIDISLTERMTREQVNALKTGHIDIGFGRVLINEPDLEQYIVFKERLVVVLPKEHPLAERKQIALKELTQERLILYPKTENPNYTDQIIEIFYRHSLRPNIGQVVAGLQTAIGIIASGMGVTLIPFSAQKMRSDDVVYIDLKNRDIHSPVTMSYRKNETKPVVLDFIKRVKFLSAIDKMMRQQEK